MAAVNLKLPPFWPSDPDLWFAQVEAQFATRGITAQRTKYEYIVASLSPEFATQVRGLILCTPAATPYDTLKQQLIARTTLPKQRRLQQLFASTELGDQQPTQLLRRMQQLSGADGAGADGTLLRELFLQRLPPNVCMVLASAGDGKTLEDLAQLTTKSSPQPHQTWRLSHSPSLPATLKVYALSFHSCERCCPPSLHALRHTAHALRLLADCLAYQPHPHPPPLPLYAGTMPVLAPEPGSAPLPVPTRETGGPVRRGDRRHWPQFKSLISHYRLPLRTTVPHRYWSPSQCYTPLTRRSEYPQHSHSTGRQQHPHPHVWHTLPISQPRPTENLPLGLRSG